MSKAIRERTAWPKHPIENYSSAEEGEWGYLVFFEDGTFQFDDTQVPPVDERNARWKKVFQKGHNDEA